MEQNVWNQFKMESLDMDDRANIGSVSIVQGDQTSYREAGGWGNKVRVNKQNTQRQRGYVQWWGGGGDAYNSVTSIRSNISVTIGYCFTLVVRTHTDCQLLILCLVRWLAARRGRAIRPWRETIGNVGATAAAPSSTTTAHIVQARTFRIPVARYHSTESFAKIFRKKSVPRTRE